MGNELSDDNLPAIQTPAQLPVVLAATSNRAMLAEGVGKGGSFQVLHCCFADDASDAQPTELLIQRSVKSSTGASQGSPREVPVTAEASSNAEGKRRYSVSIPLPSKDVVLPPLLPPKGVTACSAASSRLAGCTQWTFAGDKSQELQ